MALVVGLGFLLLVIPGHHPGGRAGARDSRRGAGAGPERQRARSPAPGSSPAARAGGCSACGVTLLVLLYVPVVAISGLARRAAARRRRAVLRRSSVATVVALAIGGVVQLFIYPLFYCVLTVTYYDLRVRKEGFDLELLASSLQTA